MITKIKNSQWWTFYQRWRLLINLASLTLLFFIDCFWGGMVYIVYPILLAMVCFDNFANGMTYLLFCVPFINLNGVLNLTFQLNVGSLVGDIFYLLCILAVVVKLAITTFVVDKYRPRPIVLIFMGLFLVYCLLPIGPYSTGLWLKTVLLLLVLLAVGALICQPQIIRLQLNVRTLSVAILLASIMGCLRPLIPRLNGLIPSYGHVRFTALFSQPNFLAILCTLLVAFCIYLIISRRAKIYDYVLMFVLTALGFTTLSKACLLLMTISYVILFCWLLYRNWGVAIVVMLVVLMVVVSVCCLNGNLVLTYLGRFTEGMAVGDSFMEFMNNLTTFRYSLWVNYTLYLVQHPLVLLFGRGLGTIPLYTPINDRILSPHNFFLALLYQLGIVGAALFVTALVLMLTELKKRYPQRVHRAIWVPVLILLLLLLEEDTILYITEIPIG